MNNVLIAFSLVHGLAVGSSSQAVVPGEQAARPAVLSSSHQAIFCGLPGAEEASAEYSAAVAAVVAERVRNGLTVRGAIEAMQREFCKAGGRS